METAYKRPFAVSYIQPRPLVLFTPASCEAVAAERAGGERGLIFAKQKASRAHPSIAAASEAVAATLRLALNAGRRNLKDCLQTGLLYLRKRQKGCGEKRRAFPRGAQSARGAGRGAACRAVKTAISSFISHNSSFPADLQFAVRGDKL